MKKEFIGYYNPTETEINDAWSKGMFAFDANALLNLYRYTEVTRKDFIESLKSIKSKLFLPHQAALEYHSNRVNVIDGIRCSYSNLEEIFSLNFEKNLQPQINQFKKHPTISIDQIIKLHEDFLKRVHSELSKQQKTHPDFETIDEVLNELTSLFESAVGKEFSKEELKKIFEEGRNRYAENVPPGFKDGENKKKKGERHMYGDLIIWKELINYVKKEKSPLIFVTDDRKEDWWTIENGKTIRPRDELVKEFYDSTGIRILIYTADNFLKYAKEKKLAPRIKDKTIKEVKDVRVSDEERIEIINLINKYHNGLSNFYPVQEALSMDTYQISAAPTINDLLISKYYSPSQVNLAELQKNYYKSALLDPNLRTWDTASNIIKDSKTTKAKDSSKDGEDESLQNSLKQE